MRAGLVSRKRTATPDANREDAPRMIAVKGLRCRECRREYPQEPIHVCDFCFGPLEVVYDYDAIRQRVSRTSIAAGPRSIWRYKAFLPIDGERVVDLGTGFTPLIHAENLGKEFGLDRLYIKNDCVNPTYSFKDRPVAVAASKALKSVSTPWPALRPAIWPVRWRPTPPRRGCAPSSSSPTTWNREKSSAPRAWSPPRDRARQLRRRQPPLQRGGR